MRRILCILLITVILLGGCTACPPQYTVTNNFVGDPFMPLSTSSTASAVLPSQPSTDFGSVAFGVVCEWQRDEKGRYIAYEDGQLHLPFRVRGQGLVSNYDVGILLFVDGVAQPYRVGSDGEYAYMHTFSQKDGTKDADGITTTIADIYFTPVTGQEGDMLEFYALCMLNPHYLPSAGVQGFARTSGAFSFETRLQYNATPPEENYPEKSARLLNVNTSVVDCTVEDVLYWTETDIITKTRTKFTVEGKHEFIDCAYGVREDEPVTLRFEVWGSPYVHYGLIFFVDNEPVYTADLSDIWVTVEMGQKTIIETTLDMTGFTGESAVYAMLVPQNYFTSEIETNAYFVESTTIYLLAKESDA